MKNFVIKSTQGYQQNMFFGIVQWTKDITKARRYEKWEALEQMAYMHSFGINAKNISVYEIKETHNVEGEIITLSTKIA